MLSTTAYESRKADFLAYKDTLVKEPSGDVKKEYYVGCKDKSDWVFIHEELMKDGSLEDNIPDDSCECANDCLHSDTRGVYLLTNTEATALRNHSKVTYVHINAAAYPGTYMDNPDDVAGASGGKDIRLGDDKRPVRLIPQNEEILYNYANGEILTDEFENPLVTEVDTFYLPSATAKYSTSVVFDDENENYVDTVHSYVGFETGMVALYGNLDVLIDTNADDQATILKASGTSVTGIKTEVKLLDGTFVAWHDPHVTSGISSVGVGTQHYTKYTERDGSLPSHFPLVRSNTDQTTGLTTNSYNDAKLYVDAGISQIYTLGARSGSRVIGAKLPPTTTISGITHNSRLLLSHKANEFRFDRYTGTVKHQRDYTTAYIPSSPGADLLNRGSWQLKRMQHKVDPWQAINDNTIIEDRIMQTGDGTNVDVIVGDQDMWFGHIEFQNNLGGPTGYRGGNVLPGDGTCDVLDLVLDAPLYLDPDWFGTDNVPGNPGYHATYASLGLPASKIITRWDGTKVPHEGWARRWWMEASARSHEADIVLLPNTASEVTIVGGFSTTFPDFGSITISTSYTRAACNGTNTTYKTGTGFHGTPCASQAYGRQYGWAYNANKWFVSAYGAGSLGWENYFDITKIFHRYKPINPDLGTKDPTVSSNSWGHRRTAASSGFYWHRQGTSGSGGVSHSSRPAFFAYLTGDGVYSRVLPYTDGHAALDAGKELVDEGVIFVCAAGNNNQKIVQSDHPDYNNYQHSSNNTPLANATQSGYSSMGSHPMLKTLNRPGYPQQIGKYTDSTTNNVVYRTIAVGALDNDHDGNGKERKVSYTNMGNAVDVFAPADETLAACDNQSGTRYNRYDAYYTIGGTQSAESEDRSFNGTSSACPIAAGMIAAKLQYNRNWGWSDVKAWFRESNKEQSSDDFYLGTETASPTDTTNWSDYANLHGASPTVIWDSMSAGETWHFREPVQIRKSEKRNKTANVVWKIEEQFKETSEVSSTLLGIPRAETQLSLFSNVSSYGIDTDDFESWSWTAGNSLGAWERRRNRLYGNRYTTQTTEETQESGIRIASFPAPYSYPFGPRWERVGLYRPDTFEKYRDFISMGNDLYQIFNGLDDNHNPKSPPVTTYFDHTNAQRDFSNYGSYFRESFLSKKDVKLDGGVDGYDIDADYVSGLDEGFAAIDTWTDTWRKLNNNDLTIPGTDIKIGLREARQILQNNYKDDGATIFPDQPDTRPGYDGGLRRTVQLQSRKVFRYQPGRISGFTFGLRASKGKTAGYTNEWGIANPTDQYIFRIRSGFLRIVRRSTISLANSTFAIPENLEESIINANTVAHPYDSTDPNSPTGESLKFYELEIPQEKFNGDRLDGNGPSGYVINPEAVTMYKIEFGWYGAIGVRFYAYIPTGNNDARWVVLHTMVIENQLGQPCLQDSYFRFIYNINVTAPSTVTEPMFVYKYGASYYIDGGDEGTSQIYSASTNIKKITGIGTEALMGITPKDYIFNSVGKRIENRKLILPTRLQISSSQLAEIKTVVCKGCPGFGHVHTPGASTGSNARTIPSGVDGVTILSPGYKLEAKGTSYFTIKDIDAKVISPTISNCYIQSLDQETSPGSGQYEVAILKGFTNVSGLGVSERIITDYPVWDNVVGAAGINTTGADHPHPIKLSTMGGIVASDFKLNGSKITVQFVNPSSKDGDGYGHFADFSIGLTNCVPQVTAPDILNGWKTPAGTDIVDPILSGVTTSVLPQEKMIEGRYTHSWASIDGNGIEQGESWWPTQPRMPMGIDYRIPNVPSPAPGHCSRITFEVEDSFNVENMEYLTTYPPDNTQAPGDPPHFLQVKGDLDPTILYDGGEVTVISNGVPTNSGKTYVGTAGSYFKYDPQANENVKYSWIRISGDISSFGTTGISAVFRPIKTVTEGLSTKRKIFTYNPFPLYFVAKMRDNASFNNLSIKEEIGDFDRTITPKLYKPLDTSSTITLARNPQNVAQADPDDAPTHFDEIERLCSARVDVQNEQKLRQESSNSKVIDTVYIGAGETKSLDLTKIFGPDRAVITPDNNNTEATFFIATRVDGINAESDIQMSLNFREQ